MRTKPTGAITRSRQLASIAIAGLVATAAGGALAAQDPHANEEQCAGIVKAGMNDCATSFNECHSHVTTDNHPEAWIYVPKGLCQKITGARVVKVKDPTPVGKR